jgi:hypothetical protein
MRFAIASQRIVDAPRLELCREFPDRFNDCLENAANRSRFDRDREPAIVAPCVNEAGYRKGQQYSQDY